MNNNALTATHTHKSLSFQQFRSILTFNDEYKYSSIANVSIQESSAGVATSSTTQNDLWETIMLEAWAEAAGTENGIRKTSTYESKNENHLRLYPFVLCHLDESDTCGADRHELITSILSDEKGSINTNFYLDEIPVYNHNALQENTENEGTETETKEILNGSCFYSSLPSSLATKIASYDKILVTPLSSSLKIRKSNSSIALNKQDNTYNDIVRAVSVNVSPGVIASEHKAIQILNGFSHTCAIDIKTALSASISSIDASRLFYEIQDEYQGIISKECLDLFTEYLAGQSEIVSIELVMKTRLLNDMASWIIQGSPEENTFPWYNIGLDGSGEVVHVSDSGLDESNCYFHDASGVVPLTTDFDLTGVSNGFQHGSNKYSYIYHILCELIISFFLLSTNRKLILPREK